MDAHLEDTKGKGSERFMKGPAEDSDIVGTSSALSN